MDQTTVEECSGQWEVVSQATPFAERGRVWSRCNMWGWLLHEDLTCRVSPYSWRNGHSYRGSPFSCDYGLLYRVSPYSWENGQPFRASPFSQRDPHIPGSLFSGNMVTWGSHFRGPHFHITPVSHLSNITRAYCKCTLNSEQHYML